MRKPSRKALAASAIVSANKLALNLIYFIESDGRGPGFLLDALQEYENARAAYCDIGQGYQYSEAFRTKVRKVADVLWAERGTINPQI